MDRNLNTVRRPPWWAVLLQLSPLILQLVGEIVLRVQGVPSSEGILQPNDGPVIPAPLDEPVKAITLKIDVVS